MTRLFTYISDLKTKYTCFQGSMMSLFVYAPESTTLKQNYAATFYILTPDILQCMRCKQTIKAL